MRLKKKGVLMEQNEGVGGILEDGKGDENEQLDTHN